MTELVNLVVYHCILFYIGIAGGNVCLRLIIVVVGHEIFYCIFGEKLLKLAAKLCRKGFIVGKYQRRLIYTRNGICHSKRLTTTGNT